MKPIVPLFLFITVFLQGQDALRFTEEVAAVQKKYDTIWDAAKETIVFTGSSSIRIWPDLQERFPEFQIVNSGFGGSQASDLLQFLEELVLRFEPKKVFIYEGDNDIAAGKKSKEIVSNTLEVISRIRMQNPSTKIVLIAAKPSIARWKLRRNYKKLNRKFKKLSQKDVLLDYADVWKPMLDKRKVKEDIFIEDGLHMNSKGYEIWYRILKPFVH